MIANTKAYTFASRTSPDTNQSLQKSMLFPTLRKNKKSSLSLKNKTLQTHNPSDKNGMKELTENIKGMSLEKKEGQLVTRYIKNWADSDKFQVLSSYLTLCDLTVNRSEMPNFSYTHPLPNSLKKRKS
jgi:hypothetical protein